MNPIKKYILRKLYGGDVQRLISQNKIPDPKNSLSRLANYSFTPNVIFDIGAYKGDFTSMCLEIWPQTKIVAFEPLSDKSQELKARFKKVDVEVIDCLVGDEDIESIEFYEDETASSILDSIEYNTKKSKSFKKMKKIDSVIKELKIEPPNFLKIDTQGFEYQILKGSENNLPYIDVILVELNFIDIYQNVVLADKVIDYLSRFNFVIYDICEIHRRPLDQTLFQIDFLFVKKDSDLRKDKRWA